MQRKGREVQNCSILLKNGIDITFKDEYWFVLAHATCAKNQNNIHYVKCPQKYLYQEQQEAYLKY